MTQEEAIERVRTRFDKWALDNEDLTALQALGLVAAESEDERIRKALIEALTVSKSIVELKFRLPEPTHEKCIAWLEKQKEQKVDIDKEKLIRHCIGLILTDATDKRFKDYGLTLKDCLTWLGEQKEQKPILEVFGFKVGDAVRLIDGDGRPHIIKCFEKIEGLHGTDFYHVVFEDNTASDHIIPGDEYPNGYFTCMEKINEQEEKKPADLSEMMVHKEPYIAPVPTPMVADERKPRWEINNPHTAKWTKEMIDENFEELVEEYHKQEPAEWSDGKSILEDIIVFVSGYADKRVVAKWVSFLKSLRPQPKKNDMITPNKEFFQWIYDRLVNVHNEDPNVDYMISFKKRIEEMSFDKSHWKPSEEQMRTLDIVVSDYRHACTKGSDEKAEILKSLLEQLQKL